MKQAPLVMMSKLDHGKGFSTLFCAALFKLDVSTIHLFAAFEF